MNSLRKYKVIIAVLSVLLAISLVLLAVQSANKLLFFSNKVTVKDNIIGSIEQNWVFGVEGMLPGDSISKAYTVMLSQKENADVDFSVAVTGDEHSLADVLHIKVENIETGKTVCEGLLSEVSREVFTENIPESQTKDRTFTYQITVMMDSSAGNEYTNQKMTMGFNWSVVPLDTREGDVK